MKIGDLVKFVDHSATEYENHQAGLVLEVDVSMWGDETVPRGIKVLWAHCPDGVSQNIEIVYEDELQVISESTAI
tara:strand:- start:224 stop:448 length:225 start_codon:yes stop_codon:yes gene_type:complete